MRVTELGPYLVYEQLGAGGMAVVHRAHRRTGSGTPIALKRLLPQLALMPEFVQAFLDEARLAKHLRHPNVVQMYDFGNIDGTYYIAMELVRGPTLAHLQKQSAAVPIPIAVHILAQVCEALAYAHALTDPEGQPLGIIHRDVSPSNVIVSTDGDVKLIDFGIAKAATHTSRTKKGFIKGKFGYVAPEYVAGRIDARVDLFGAGVIAHELLTGKKLFQVANDMETLQRVQSMPIEPPSASNPNVPPALDEVIMMALQRDPDERFQTAVEMRDTLAAVVRALGTPPTPKEVAAWVAKAVGSPMRSDASGVSMELELIEAATTGVAQRKIGGRVMAAEHGRQRTLLAVLTVIALVMVGIAVYLAVR
jgi:eukaryotic-like serine/threonine-protein kinase